MRRLWAPWRIEYILSDKSTGCIFCEIISQDSSRDEENLVLYRGEKAFIIMNKYPYNNGHLMIVPYRHIADPRMLDDEELLEISRLVNLSMDVIESVMKPDGFNIGVNIGEAAGAGVKDHYHVHIVPRWIGDTNFMPIISDTKVVVEALRETYKKLRREIEARIT